MSVDKINIAEKFSRFSELWSPKIIAELNNQEVKIAKVKGEFVWHDHAYEDELFLIIKGKLSIAFEDETLELNEGELCVVPKGTKHKPFAAEETWILLLEPSEIKHTGEVKDKLSQEKKEWI